MIICTFEKGFTDKLRHVVVHALAVKDGKILLGKRADTINEGGKWNIPGGFMQRDETAKTAALRELKEETGWDGEIISLFHVNTNPFRPHEDRQNVILEFLIKPLQQTGKSDWETPEIAWVAFDEILPSADYAFDHGESIQKVIEYYKRPFPLPFID
jgi:8-oxo-dGTP diphosphatase